MKKVLFVHGLGSSTHTRTCTALRRALPKDQYKVICPEYPIEDCEKAIDFFKDYIEKENIDIIVGHSLGGFVTLAIDTNKPKVVLCPCLRPGSDLSIVALGTSIAGLFGHRPSRGAVSTNMVETYKTVENELFVKPVQPCSNIKGFFADNDILMGTKYVESFTETFGEATIVPGEHHKLNVAMPTIANAVMELTK